VWGAVVKEDDAVQPRVLKVADLFKPKQEFSEESLVEKPALGNGVQAERFASSLGVFRNHLTKMSFVLIFDDVGSHEEGTVRTDEGRTCAEALLPWRSPIVLVEVLRFRGSNDPTLVRLGDHPSLVKIKARVGRKVVVLHE
jgi:hypothetical protein